MHRHDRSHSSTANAFSPQLPLSHEAGTTVFGPPGAAIPPACKLCDDGGAILRLYAPTAQSVRLMGFPAAQDFVKDEAGLWTLKLEQGAGGFRPLLLSIDGVEVLSPMLPIGYSSCRAIHFLDLPRNDLTLCQHVPHGGVSREIYWSETTQNWESCMVYTPPGYHKSAEDYPVLYLQHGHGENETCWTYHGKINFIMDNLLAQGRAKPCLIVMNNGMVPTEADGSFASRPWLFEPLLLRDCIPFIEANYRCKTDRLSRAIGSQDFFGGIFREESEMPEGYGLGPAQWPAHREVFYEGGHEWNVWRDCAADFLPLLF